MSALAAPVRLRDLTTGDLEAAHRLSRDAGWNQREADWRLLLQLNPGRFVAATAEDRVVGTGGAACYGAALAWVCMILVDARWRGGGIGKALVEGVLDRVGDAARIGLDATPAGRPVYLGLGFGEVLPLVRMAAPPTVTARPAAAASALAEEDVEAVLGLDQEVFGADRSAVLRWMLARSGAWCVRGADGISAYGFLRDGEHSRHLGPGVARDVSSARAVAAAAQSVGDGRPLLVDVPARGDAWRGALEDLGFREQRPLLRMFRHGARPPGDPRLQLAILGPEFG